MPPRAGGTATTHDSGDVQIGARSEASPDGLVRVVCLLCGRAAAADDLFWGCGACGVSAPLTVADPPPQLTGLMVGDAVREARCTFSRGFAGIDIRAPMSTPMTAAPTFGAGVFLKHEAFSLTGSHKDRFHAVAARVALALGARGIVASSTGNHGVSAAAHAAAAGLPAVVFCHPEAPAGLLRAIGAFGGEAAQLDSVAQREELIALVREGWFPATSMDPALSGAANPFAVEGYKAIACETVEQLGRLPEAVFIPTAGGDTLYGVMKGFAELAALCGAPMPTVFAVQPEGASSLSQSLTAGTQVAVAEPHSIALSIADPRSGRHAMIAIARWGGGVLDVAEAAIETAMIDLARIGVYIDPASAAALAGYRLAVARGDIAADALSVLLLTSSGFKWPDAMAAVFPSGAVRDAAELRRRLALRSGA
jgi:threonine synthase